MRDLIMYGLLYSFAAGASIADAIGSCGNRYNCSSDLQGHFCSQEASC